jgi:hypothetical protein
LGSYNASYVDDDGDAQTLSAEGSLVLLGVNTDRLAASDFTYGGDLLWRDEFDRVFGLSEAV